MLSSRNVYVHVKGLSKDRRLRPPFIGPFQIRKVLGQRTYELTLPVGSRLRNMFDVSRLKAATAPLEPGTSPEIVADEEGRPQLRELTARQLKVEACGHFRSLAFWLAA